MDNKSSDADDSEYDDSCDGSRKTMNATANVIYYFCKCIITRNGETRKPGVTTTPTTGKYGYHCNHYDIYCCTATATVTTATGTSYYYYYYIIIIITAAAASGSKQRRGAVAGSSRQQQAAAGSSRLQPEATHRRCEHVGADARTRYLIAPSKTRARGL